MRAYLPIKQWISGYKTKDIPKDLLAGFTIGVILVPQAMAYAMIAGLPPVYGLYAALIPVLVYSFLGTSRSLGVGPVAIDSLVVSIGLGAMALSGADYITMAIFLAFFVGGIQLLFGLMRMGFLVNFLSRPVISAFITGAAVVIFFGQFKHLIGVKIPQTIHFYEMIGFLFQKLGETNIYDLVIGLAGIALIVMVRRWKRHFPVALLVVIFGTIAVYFFKMESKGVEIVGSVAKGLPGFEIPTIEMQAFADLWPIALTLAMLGYFEAISIAKGLEDKSGEDRLDPNQELVALGFSNMIGSFFKSYPVSASFSRSAIASETGAKSNFIGLFSAILVLLTLLFLTPLFYYLPNAALASIIMVAVYNLADWSYARRLWRLRKDEFMVWLVTFLSILFIGIVQALLIGVVFSLFLMVYRSSMPHYAILGRIRNSDYYKNVERFEEDIDVRPDLLIMRFDAQLYFGNTNYFKKQLKRKVEQKGNGLKAVVLNAEAINYIDSTAAQMLRKLISNIKSEGIKFYIIGAIGPTRDILFSSGIAQLITPEYMFVRIQEAVDHFDQVEQGSEIVERLTQQRNRKLK